MSSLDSTNKPPSEKDLPLSLQSTPCNTDFPPEPEDDGAEDIEAATLSHEELEKINEAVKKKEYAEFFQLFKDSSSFRSMLIKETGMSKKSRPNGTYHRREYGEQAKVVLDLLLQQESQGIYKPKRWLFKDYPKYKRQTLYQRIHQSIRYVLLEMDDEKLTYTGLFNRTIIRKEPDGIYIRWKKDMKSLVDFMSAEDLPEDNVPVPEVKEKSSVSWKDLLENFLEGKDITQTKFIQEGLELSDEEILWVKRRITDTGLDFVTDVDSFRIAVVRID